MRPELRPAETSVRAFVKAPRLEVSGEGRQAGTVLPKAGRHLGAVAGCIFNDGVCRKMHFQSQQAGVLYFKMSNQFAQNRSTKKVFQNVIKS